MLETLERENLFVVSLDDERRWYRYHHLFADALRARLAARHADRVGELHAAASRWHAENGLLGDAVRHAIASGDNEREPARERELAAGRGRDGDDEDGEQRDLDRVGVVQDDEQCAGERGAPVARYGRVRSAVAAVAGSARVACAASPCPSSRCCG
jgi:hypothetical protein